MKANNKKNQLKDSAKALITLIAVNSALSLGIIVAALTSNRPEYNKAAHQSAKQAYDRACDAYDITYNVARQEAYADNENQALLSEIMATDIAMERCDNSLNYETLSAKYDSLYDELDNRISDKMATHAGLDAATTEMADALAVLEKYERDYAARAAWANEPLKYRINNGLQKIFMNERTFIALKHMSFNKTK